MTLAGFGARLWLVIALLIAPPSVGARAATLNVPTACAFKVLAMPPPFEVAGHRGRAERAAGGEADLAIQQMSKLMAMQGPVLLGPLPREIQSYTTYSAALSRRSAQGGAPQALVALLRSPASAAAIATAGTEAGSS